MITIHSTGAHFMLPLVCRALKEHGQKETSRNGNVLAMPCPTTLHYTDPLDRVLFWPERDANPFLHFFESLWMLAGRNDVDYMTRLVRRFAAYSDDGKTFNGAYGYRWRKWFGRDQLQQIIGALRSNPQDRRCVLGMWDAGHDLGLQSVDLPCNTHIYFRIQDDRLNMTVCNRSNDAIWGAVGANVVHMSFLQEYMALMIGVPVGEYWQVSNNLHVYEPHWPLMERMAEKVVPEVPQARPYPHFPLIAVRHRWDQELNMFLDEGLALGMREPFFRMVAQPMKVAFDLYKERKFDEAVEHLEYNCEASDWARAATEWLKRRKAAAQEALRNEAGPRDE